MASLAEKSAAMLAFSSVMCAPVPVISMAIISPPRASPRSVGRHGQGPALQRDHGSLQQTDRRAEAVAVTGGGEDGRTSKTDLVEAALDEIGGGNEEDETEEDCDRKIRASQRLPRAFH